MGTLQAAKTEIFWVVGENTNVGKTLISTALIRLLNARGTSTVGLKPYAGSALTDIVDVLEEISESPPRQLVGRDAPKIAAASPLTPETLLEVVNPSWRIYHPSRSESVLVRKGSACLGNREFFKTRRTERFYLREDIRDLSARLNLPFQSAAVIDDCSADSVDALHQDKQTEAFAHLMSLRPDAIVCEGAGRLLPAWQGCPPIDHMMIVARGSLYVFPNIDLKIEIPAWFQIVPTVAAIAGQLKRHRCLSSEIPILSKANGEARLAKLLERVLLAVSKHKRSLPAA